MKVAVFDTHNFERQILLDENQSRHELTFLEVRLGPSTAELARGCKAIACFANDKADRETLLVLNKLGVKLIALRSAGYNHVDVNSAKELDIKVVRVPAYSPYSVAEHAVALLQTFNRKIHRAHNRVHDMNFSLEGLIGFDLHGKTVGVIGTGRIGKVFSEIMRGYGCHVLAFDKFPDKSWAEQNKISYITLPELLKKSDIVSLHVPFTAETFHILNAEALAILKTNAIIINTGRGGLIDTKALINSLKKGTIGGACLDVYEEESGVFFNDLSDVGIADDILARLLTFPNVLVTSHQGFLTKEAIHNISATTIQSLTKYENGDDLNLVLVN
ncbi:MAG: 2-hydroxyacid dehydrogenase [Bdellovibrionota bacterium]